MAGNEGWKPKPLHILAAALGHPKNSELAHDVTLKLTNLIEIIEGTDRGMLHFPSGTDVLKVLDIEDPCPNDAKVSITQYFHIISVLFLYEINRLHFALYFNYIDFETGCLTIYLMSINHLGIVDSI